MITQKHYDAICAYYGNPHIDKAPSLARDMLYRAIAESEGITTGCAYSEHEAIMDELCRLTGEPSLTKTADELD